MYTLSYEENADSNTVVIDDYTYDAHGNVIKMVTVGADGEITKSIEVQYQLVFVENGISEEIQEVLDDFLVSIYGGFEE